MRLSGPGFRVAMSCFTCQKDPWFLTPNKNDLCEPVCQFKSMEIIAAGSFGATVS